MKPSNTDSLPETAPAEALEQSTESCDEGTSPDAIADRSPTSPAAAPELVVLDVPPGMAWYAELHGAVFDPARNSWIVRGELPSELINLLPQVQATRARLPDPFCPLCGCHMRKVRARRTGNEFWGCSKYRRTGCSGTMSLEEHLDRAQLAIAPTVVGVLGRPTPLRHGTDDSNEVKARSLSETARDLEKAVREIAEAARAVLGTEVAGWFDRPSVGLGYDTPAQLLRTSAGRQRLLEYLLKLRKYG